MNKTDITTECLIVSIMTEKGITVPELAERSGVHWKTINNIRCNYTLPTLSVLFLLSGALGVAPVELYPSLARVPQFLEIGNKYAV